MKDRSKGKSIRFPAFLFLFTFFFLKTGFPSAPWAAQGINAQKIVSPLRPPPYQHPRAPVSEEVVFKLIGPDSTPSPGNLQFSLLLIPDL